MQDFWEWYSFFGSVSTPFFVSGTPSLTCTVIAMRSQLLPSGLQVHHEVFKTRGSDYSVWPWAHGSTTRQFCDPQINLQPDTLVPALNSRTCSARIHSRHLLMAHTELQRPIQGNLAENKFEHLQLLRQWWFFPTQYASWIGSVFCACSLSLKNEYQRVQNMDDS